MEAWKQVGIFALCWALGVPLAYALAWWWEFPNSLPVIIPVSFVLGIIVRFIPSALDELV